jgi:hypothetical protein
VVLDSPERRRKVIDMLWDLAYRRVEGGDNSIGDFVPADQVWEQFKTQLGDLGLELTVVPSDGSEVVIPLSILEDNR